MSTANVLFPNDEEIYKIVKGLPNAEKLQNKIWESFCLENDILQNDRKATQKQRRFKKHPTNFQNKKDDAEEDCSSDDLADALFGPGGLKQQSQRAKSEKHPQDDEYDSLDEFCDVTFRKIGSVLHTTSLNAADVKCPAAKKIMPSVVPSRPVVKMMSAIKPKKKEAILNETCAGIVENTTKLEMDTIAYAYDMNKDRRLKTVLQKCNNSMDDIRLLIDIGIPQPDGEEDYLRRKKRAVEFSNRFSRIYLYQLNRLIHDIRKLLRSHTTQKALHESSVKMNLSTRTNITQKFIQTFQLVQQSLQAYYNHLPTSIIIGAPEKVKDLLNLCITICQLQNVVVSTPGAAGDKGDADNIFTPFNTRSKSLLERINECCQINSTTSLLKSNRSKLSLLGYNVAKGKGVGDVNSKMQLSENRSRFSMYGGGGTGKGCRKDAYWRNAIAVLGKKHFNVTSRYKTAKFKHRPDLADHRLPSTHQHPFQAFPINLKSTSNDTYPNYRSQQDHIGRKPSDMSVSNAKLAVGRRRRRYSLNDDNVKTQMQNVREDAGVTADSGDVIEDVDEEGSSSGEVVRRRRSKNQKGDTNCHHHHNKTTLPQPPNSSPQHTPNANEFIGESSQCDLLPPSIQFIPQAPVSTTNTPKSSLCQLHQSHTINYQEKSSNEFVQDSSDGCQKCTCKHQEMSSKKSQLATSNSLAYEPCNECHECQKQLTADDGDKSSSNKDKKKPRNNDDNWNRLSVDCDRTLRRLDERMVGCCGASGRAKGVDGEVGDEKGVKRDMAKKLAGLVKKSLMVGDDARGTGNGGDNRRDKVTVTSVTGAKNAKLICIRDDNSLILDATTSDIAEEETPLAKGPQQQPDKSVTNQLQYAHSQTQTDVSAQGQLFDSNDSRARQQLLMNATNGQKRKNVKISRLPKSKIRRQLPMLDKEMSLNVIRYKLDYHKARKENLMYKKAANGVQPWTLMEKVSDGILDHLLLSVAREIQVDDILVKLYESEFYAA